MGESEGKCGRRGMSRIASKSPGMSSTIPTPTKERDGGGNTSCY